MVGVEVIWSSVSCCAKIFHLTFTMGKGEDIPYLHLNKKKQHCGRDISWIRGIYSSVTICSKNCHLIFALGKGEEIPYLIQNKNKHGHVVPQKTMKGGKTQDDCLCLTLKWRWTEKECNRPACGEGECLPNGHGSMSNYCSGVINSLGFTQRREGCKEFLLPDEAFNMGQLPQGHQSYEVLHLHLAAKYGKTQEVGCG